MRGISAALKRGKTNGHAACLMLVMLVMLCVNYGVGTYVLRTAWWSSSTSLKCM